MKNKKFYLIFSILVIAIVGVLFTLNNKVSEEELKVESFYPDAKKIELIKDISDDIFISLNFPGVKRAYKVDGKLKVYVASCVGYKGEIDILVAMDSESDELKGIEILEHIESEDYAGHIEDEWFLKRFKNLLVDKYLNLVVLDKENPEDIIQVTGATVSSQAIVNAVNAAIGVYQYKINDVQMERVADVVPQEMWQKDINSFAINWEEDSIRIDREKIEEYQQLDVEAVLINTTGRETSMKAKGPTLRSILQEEGLDLDDYEGVGITGRDGYYTMIDGEKLKSRDIVLAYEVDGKELKEEEKPVRIVVPNELGPYWVKMVSNIDLYEEITPKDIDKVHIFDALTQDIEPYYYEYYGSKDKSIEVGRILRKFDTVDKKGFFTMAASDGLIKNETISLVGQRYFIKVEGENAPMNIAPNFKLGMNVKHMTHFSTTKDAVIFPEKMGEVVSVEDIDGREGLLLEDVLYTVGMNWTDEDKLIAISKDGLEVEINIEEMMSSYIVDNENSASLYHNGKEIIKDLLRIEKR